MKNELYHHGREGQKWGVRNGPPYPLNAAGNAKFRKNNLKQGKKSNSDYGSPSIAIATALGLAAGKFVIPGLVEKGKAIAKKHGDNKLLKQRYKPYLKSQKKGPIDPKTGLHLKTREWDEFSDLAPINPASDLKNRIPATNQNCVACGIAYEMRRRGYDVSAAVTEEYKTALDKIDKGFPGSKPKAYDPYGIYGDPPFKDYKLNIPENTKEQYDRVEESYAAARTGSNTKLADACMSALSKEKNSRGVLLVTYPSGNGHCVSYRVDDKGDIAVLDGQAGYAWTQQEKVKNLLSSMALVNSIRLDNCDVNMDVLRGAIAG